MMSYVESQREKLYQLLGKLPDRHRPIHVEKVAEEDRGTYWFEKLMLDLNGEQLVPAYFLKPKHTSGKVPAILYNHAHGGKYDIGKEELLTGRGALQDPPYGELLTGMGYAVLCMDTWAFGERADQSEADIFKQMLWHGKVMWGMMVYDSLRGMDYLVSREDIDSERIGTIGISMGSTMAWWVAALDPRVKVTIDLCCMTDFQELEERQLLSAHGLYYYVPDLLNHFTTASINELIAPRPHLSLNGDRDKLTPVPGLIKIDEHLKQVYAEQGKPEAWQMLRYDVGHTETAEMREAVIRFLEKWL